MKWSHSKLTFELNGAHSLFLHLPIALQAKGERTNFFGLLILLTLYFETFFVVILKLGHRTEVCYSRPLLSRFQFHGCQVLNVSRQYPGSVIN